MLVNILEMKVKFGVTVMTLDLVDMAVFRRKVLVMRIMGLKWYSNPFLNKRRE